MARKKGPKLLDLSSGWKSNEVIERDSDGNPTVFPFSGPLTSSGTTPVQALNKVRMVQDLGWPRAKIGLTDDRGKKLIVSKDEVVWLLKCKPSCWRLYLYVVESTKELNYVHSVCKKQDAEDPADASTARRVADRAIAGKCTFRPIFPPGSTL